MSYKEMDSEFVDLVNMAFESDLRVEIIYEAIKTAQEHPYTSSPKLALEIAMREWDI
jgi:hypothetical protein